MELRLMKWSPTRVLVVGYCTIIFIGTVLLALPLSAKSGSMTSVSDAFFTATSAACVTGLVRFDTFTHWSLFGQIVILLLIQVGGMGFVTIALFTHILSRQKIGLSSRVLMREAVSAPQVGGIVRMTRFILKGTLLIEGLGAVFLAVYFCPRLGVLKGVYYAVFHSVSAFCNAGFDLMGIRQEYSSLTFFAENWIVNGAVMALIIIGGIGFMTWDDIRTHRYRVRRYRMQSKVILTTTALLVTVPALYFFFFEFSGEPLYRRILMSCFQSVTPRTAGFNTADLSRMSETGLGIIILLMLIGGSPGSTAGGMKTTTFAVLLSTAAAVFHRREHAHFFGRRIDNETVRSGVTVLVMYLTLFLGGGLIISRVEGLPLLPCMFETASAMATVGLSLGLTPGLGLVSRGVLIVLMYIGRVGGLTLIFAAMSDSRGANTARLPQEKLMVG